MSGYQVQKSLREVREVVSGNIWKSCVLMQIDCLFEETLNEGRPISPMRRNMEHPQQRATDLFNILFPSLPLQVHRRSIPITWTRWSIVRPSPEPSEWVFEANRPAIRCAEAA